MNRAILKQLERDRPAERVMFVLLMAFFAILALGGGSARFDVQSVLFVRGAAILLILMAFLLHKDWSLIANWRVTLAISAIVAIVAVQVIPLPPTIWAQLPGRDPFVPAAALAGIEQPWRPISVTPGATLNALVAWLVPVAAFIGVRCLGRVGRSRLLAAFLILIVISGMIGMMQVAGGPTSPLRLYRITNPDHAVGLFANRNHQAFFLALGFPLLFAVLGRVRSSQSLIPRIVLGSASLLLLTMIWMTGSRMGVILSLVSITVSALTFPHVISKDGRILRNFLIASSLVLAIMFALGLFQSEAITRMMAQDPAQDLRVLLWGDLVKLMGDYFPVGSGFGSFPVIYQHVERAEMLDPRYVNHAHNDLVELAIEGGLAAISLALAFLAWWIAFVVRAYRNPKRGSGTVVRAKVAAIGTGLLLLSCLTDYPLRTPLLSAVFAVFCGLMLDRPHASREPA